MEWDAEKELNNLPKHIRNSFRKEAEELFRELQNRYLEVTLIPAPYPKHYLHMIRTTNNTNPEWYSELYQNHYCKLNRKCTENALDRLRKLKDPKYIRHNYKYDAFFRDFIFQRLTRGLLHR